jgi:hypothetical protein
VQAWWCWTRCTILVWKCWMACGMSFIANNVSFKQGKTVCECKKSECSVPRCSSPSPQNPTLWPNVWCMLTACVWGDVSFCIRILWACFFTHPLLFPLDPFAPLHFYHYSSIGPKVQIVKVLIM